MSNQLGDYIRVTSMGESHGAGVAAVLEGIPTGMRIDRAALQAALDKRKPSTAAYSTQRREADALQIQTGIYEECTLGSPITLWIANEDAHSQDYEEYRKVYRPGHADAGYALKYAHRDHRGGGRSSIRVWAPLVAAGDLCRQYLAQKYDIELSVFVCQVGEYKFPPEESKSNEGWRKRAAESKYRMAEEGVEKEIDKYISMVKEEGDTLGGMIHASILGLPAGWGEPIFGKIQAKLALYLMSINTSKGIEFGEGFSAASMRGSVHNDEWTEDGYASNHAGGSLGGITTGQELMLNLAMKPISSIRREQAMRHENGSVQRRKIQGRHDVFALPRAVPIVEALIYLALADLEAASRLG